MDRRTFLKLAAASTTYSVLINVNGWAATTPSSSLRDQISQRHNQIAPDEPALERFSGEPHMTLVDLECDLFIAGGGMSGVCAAVAAARHGARLFWSRTAHVWVATPPAKSKCISSVQTFTGVVRDGAKAA
jgi:hypothetical protein